MARSTASTVSGAAGISNRGRSELTAALGRGRRFVTPADVVGALSVDNVIAAKKLARWAEAGWLRRVRRGLYIPVPLDAATPGAWSEDALVIATSVWGPCYFTGWTAASHWSLTDQVFRTTVLKTNRRVRASSARLLDHDYLVTHVAKKQLEWGITVEWRGEIRLLMADQARTVLDILDRPRLGGGVRHSAEIVATFLDDHDPSQIIDYGDRLGNRAVFKRLGYIVEVLGKDRDGLLDACRQRLTAGISPLDPDGPSEGRRVSRWGLRVNGLVGPEEPA
jgi:predicted transcriptional regulator of viral defense system